MKGFSVTLARLTARPAGPGKCWHSSPGGQGIEPGGGTSERFAAGKRRSESPGRVRQCAVPLGKTEQAPPASRGRLPAYSDPLWSDSPLSVCKLDCWLVVVCPQAVRTQPIRDVPQRVPCGPSVLSAVSWRPSCRYWLSASTASRRGRDRRCETTPAAAQPNISGPRARPGANHPGEVPWADAERNGREAAPQRLAAVEGGFPDLSYGENLNLSTAVRCPPQYRWSILPSFSICWRMIMPCLLNLESFCSHEGYRPSKLNQQPEGF